MYDARPERLEMADGKIIHFEKGLPISGILMGILYTRNCDAGEMAEWLKAAVC
jgi:hypothetical protein